MSHAERLTLQQLLRMEKCKYTLQIINLFSVTWGNPDDGKLGHLVKVETEDEKKKKFEIYRKTGYTPKNYAEKNEIDFVSSDFDGKKIV